MGKEGARAAAPLDHGLHEKWGQRFVGCFVLAGSDRKRFQSHHGSQDLPVGQQGDAQSREDFILELKVKNVA